jgi:hypothetical protein
LTGTGSGSSEPCSCSIPAPERFADFLLLEKWDISLLASLSFKTSNRLAGWIRVMGVLRHAIERTA